MMTHVDHPWHPDGSGRTATADRDDHIRNLIEQVLFTTPGERVNRPDFGSGLLRLVFAPNSDALADAVSTGVQASLQRWLRDLVRIDAVDVTRDDATIEVTVRYVVRRTQQAAAAQFRRPV